MINWFTISLFEGFAFFVVASLIASRFSPKWKLQQAEMMEVAVAIVRITSIAWIITWLIGLYTTSRNDELFGELVQRMTGPYWFGYWLYPFIYGVLPQLLWVRRLQHSKVALLGVALPLMFALYIERFVIVITSLHHDYIPGGWMILPYIRLGDWLLSLFIFAIVLISTYRVRITKLS